MARIPLPLIGLTAVGLIGAGVVIAGGSDDPVIAPAEPALVAEEAAPTPAADDAASEPKADAAEERSDASKERASGAQAAVFTGPKLPKVQAQSTDGTIDFAALRGPAIVHVFASWCSVCRAEAAELGKALNAAPGVKPIWIAVQDDPASSKAFQTEFAWRSGPRIDDEDRSVAAKLGLSGQPNTILVDAAGNTQRFAGAVPVPTLKALLARLDA